MKNILQTKTLWLNIFGPIFSYLAVHYGLDLTPDEQAAVITSIMAIANIIMRRFTSTSVKFLPTKGV